MNFHSFGLCIAANISSLAPIACTKSNSNTLLHPLYSTQNPSTSFTPCMSAMLTHQTAFGNCVSHSLIPSSPAAPSAPYSCSPPYPHNRLLDPHTSSPSRPPSTLTRNLFLRLWSRSRVKIPKRKWSVRNQSIHSFLTFLLSLHFLLNLLP